MTWLAAVESAKGSALFGFDAEDAEWGSGVVGVAGEQGVAQRGWRGAASRRMAPPEGVQEFGPRLVVLDCGDAEPKGAVDGQAAPRHQTGVALPGADFQRLAALPKGVREWLADEQ